MLSPYKIFPPISMLELNGDLFVLVLEKFEIKLLVVLAGLLELLKL